MRIGDCVGAIVSPCTIGPGVIVCTPVGEVVGSGVSTRDEDVVGCRDGELVVCKEVGNCDGRDDGSCAFRDDGVGFGVDAG